jgi:hypothetical protein
MSLYFNDLVFGISRMDTACGKPFAAWYAGSPCVAPGWFHDGR